MRTHEDTLDNLAFVTDKFSKNYEPWMYAEEDDNFVHIRYKSDFTGYNHWSKRLKRFVKQSTVRYFKPSSLSKQLGFVKRDGNWFTHVRVMWAVYMVKDTNHPDAFVNEIPIMWDEDAVYFTLFSPIVGREVLDYLTNHPEEKPAQKIIAAIVAAEKASWPEAWEGEGGGERNECCD